MKCHEVRRQLDLFMDNEMDVRENMKVLEHLNLCPACTELFEGERLLREHLVERLAAKAPAGLNDRIRARLGRPRRRILRWMVAASAAVVLVAASAIFWVHRPRLADAGTIATQAAQFHRASRDSMPAGGVRADPSVTSDPVPYLANFYQGKLDHTPCLHELKKAGYDFKYGSFWKFGDRLVCWTQQRSNEHVISHTVLPMKVEGSPMQIFERDGCVVAVMVRVEGFT